MMMYWKNPEVRISLVFHYNGESTWLLEGNITLVASKETESLKELAAG
jgi:hypothetical protein